MSDADYQEAVDHVDMAAATLKRLATGGANYELIEAAQVALEIARESLEAVIASLPLNERNRILSMPIDPANN